MKKTYLVVMFLLLGIMLNNYSIYHDSNTWIIPEYFLEYPKGTITRKNIRNKEIPKDYLLAMIPIHECVNTNPEDAAYIIEAAYNRELVNWGGYGDLYEQVLSSEFKGLIDKNFYFNPENPKHIMCLELSRKTLKGEKLLEKKIFGWVSYKDPNQTFVRKVRDFIVKTETVTFHKFWTWPH